MVGQRIPLRKGIAIELTSTRRRTSLIHSLKTYGIESAFLLKQSHTLTLGPQSLTRLTRVNFGRRAGLNSLQIKMQPAIANTLHILPRLHIHNTLHRTQRTDEILLVPASEDYEFLRRVVHTGLHYRCVPLPAVLAHDRRIGLHGILIEVVKDKTIDTVTRKRTLTTHREQATIVTDNLHLVGCADILRRATALLDTRFGE